MAFWWESTDYQGCMFFRFVFILFRYLLYRRLILRNILIKKNFTQTRTVIAKSVQYLTCNLSKSNFKYRIRLLLSKVLPNNDSRYKKLLNCDAVLSK